MYNTVPLILQHC